MSSSPAPSDRDKHVAAKRHTTTSYSEAKAHELGVNTTRGGVTPEVHDKDTAGTRSCEGRMSSAAQGRPWWSYIPVVNLVILWAKYGWEGFE